MMEEDEPVSSGRAGLPDDNTDVEGRATGGGSDFFTALGTTQSSRKEKEAVQAQVVVEEVSSPTYISPKLNITCSLLLVLCSC